MYYLYPCYFLHKIQLVDFHCSLSKTGLDRRLGLIYQF